MSVAENMKELSLYKYLRYLRFILLAFGAWPAEKLGDRVPLLVRYLGAVVRSFCWLGFFGQVGYLVKFYGEMNFLMQGRCLINTLLSILTLVRCHMPCFKTYGKIMKVFFHKFHLGHYKVRGVYSLKMWTVTDKISYWLTVWLMVLVINCGIFFNLPAVYNNYQNGVYTRKQLDNITLTYSVYVYIPGFDLQGHFVLSCIVSYTLTFFCCLTINSTDLLLYVIMLQVIGHIWILQDNLNNIRPRIVNHNEDIPMTAMRRRHQDEMYNEDENRQIHGQLVECIEHHRIIVSFAKDISEFFGPIIGISYFYELIGLCLLMLECSLDIEAVLSFGLIMLFTLGQLIQTSVIFEAIGTASDKLPNCVYETPWEYMNTRNRRTVCIVLNRMQTPIRVTAMGMTPIGVTTMASILRKAFSYFLLLRSFT